MPFARMTVSYVDDLRKPEVVGGQKLFMIEDPSSPDEVSDSGLLSAFLSKI